MTMLARLLLAALLSVGLSLPLAAEPQPRFVTMDWTVAEVLLAIGVVPQGVGEIAGYRAWVGTPAMPESVQDIGLRTQPNLELLVQMSPDQILLTRMFRSLEPTLSRIAPTTLIDNQAGETAWQAMVAQTEEIGRRAGRSAAASALVRDTEEHIERLRKELNYTGKPVLIVQFMDAVHARVFGSDSLYGSVLKRLDIENAWNGRTNSWGFALTSLRELAAIEARLVVVRPVPVGTRLSESGLWQTLPSVRRNDVLWLPPSWSFGALPSARRFADILVAAL